MEKVPLMKLTKMQSMIDGTSTLTDLDLIDADIPLQKQKSIVPTSTFKTNEEDNEKLKAMYKEFYEAYAKNKQKIVEVSVYLMITKTHAIFAHVSTGRQLILQFWALILTMFIRLDWWFSS